MLLLKNTTVNPIPLTDIGITVAASATYDATSVPPTSLRKSKMLATAIANETIALGDGLIDLSVPNALSVVYGAIRDVSLVGVINDGLTAVDSLWSSDFTESLILENRTGHVHHHSLIVDDEPEKHFLINDGGPHTDSVWSSTKVVDYVTQTVLGDHTHHVSDITDMPVYAYRAIQIVTATGSGLAGGGDLANNVNLSVVPSDIVHQSLSGAGTNSHSQIDSHIADATKHRQINNNGTTATDLWAADKLISEFSLKSNTDHSHLSYISTTMQIITATNSGLRGGSTLDNNVTLTVYPSEINHDALSGHGTNSHSQIDSHIADATKHRQINNSGVGATDLWAADKLISEFSLKSDIGHTHVAYVPTTTQIMTNVGSGLQGGGYLNGNLILSVRQQDITHQSIGGTGTTTHAQLDAHVADTAKHNLINNGGTGASDLWNGQYLMTQFTSKQNALGYVPENVASKGVANGYCPLNANSVIPDAYLPPKSIVNTYVRDSLSAQLVLTVQEGDFCIRTDISKTYISLGSNNLSISDWQEILAPAATVTSVNEYTGAIVLTKTDIGLGSVVNGLQFLVSNNLSECVPSTVRANISVPSVADLTSHTSSTVHNIGTAQYNADKIQGITVYDAARADTYYLGYNAGQNRIDYKPIPVTSVNGYMGAVNLTKTDLGLGSVINGQQFLVANNLSDGNAATIRTNISVPSVADLTAHSSSTVHNIGTAQYNADKIQGITVYDASRSDGYHLVYNSAQNRIEYQAVPVTSVASKTGAVTLVPSDVGLGSVVNGQQFLVANNLGEGNAATIRTNISVPSVADLLAHTSQVTGPVHGNTTAQWNADKIQGITVDGTAAGDGKALVFDGATSTLKYQSIVYNTANTLPFIQVRRAVSFAFTTSYLSVTWDTQDNLHGTDISLNTGNYTQVLINADGAYMLSYDMTVYGNLIWEMQITKNGTQIPGSYSRNYDNSAARYINTSCTSIEDLVAGDILVLRIKGSTSANCSSATLKVVKLSLLAGPKGDKGDPGSGVRTQKLGTDVDIDATILNFGQQFAVTGGSGTTNIGLSNNVGASILDFWTGQNGVTCTGATATVLGRAIYRGTAAALTPTTVSIIAAMSASPTETGTFKVFDITNNVTIGTITIPTGATTTPTIYTTTISGSLPLNPAIFELRGNTVTTRTLTIYFFSLT